MCRDNPAGCDRGIVSPSRPILELPTYIRVVSYTHLVIVTAPVALATTLPAALTLAIVDPDELHVAD